MGEEGMEKMILRKLFYREVENRNEFQFCDICNASFDEDDEVSILRGAWGILLICHSWENPKEFFKNKKYQNYPEKLMGITLKLKRDTRIPGYRTQLAQGTGVFCYDATKKPNGVTIKVKTRHEGNIASFEEEVNKFQVVIDNEEIDLE